MPNVPGRDPPTLDSRLRGNDGCAKASVGGNDGCSNVFCRRYDGVAVVDLSVGVWPSSGRRQTTPCRQNFRAPGSSVAYERPSRDKPDAWFESRWPADPYRRAWRRITTADSSAATRPLDRARPGPVSTASSRRDPSGAPSGPRRPDPGPTVRRSPRCIRRRSPQRPGL